MIDLTEFIKDSLSTLDAPVWFQTIPPGTSAPPQFVTYIEYYTGPELQAGDNSINVKRMIQVNVWAKENYFSLWNAVKKSLESSGFEENGGWDAPREDGDTHFNRILRFIYIDEN